MIIPGIDSLIRQQEHVDYVNREVIEKIQLEKLNAILSKVHGTKSFYSAYPERLEDLEGLNSLPFTTDEDLAANPAAFLLTSQGNVERVLSDATSGTTGTPKRVFYTAADCRNTVRLFMAGLGELVGEGSVTMICMPFSGPNGLGELISEAIINLGAVPLKVGIGRSFREIREIMDTARPDTFVGMPAQLLSILRVCGPGSMKRALISGDECPAAVIGACEDILKTKLFPHYGSREMGLGGAICCRAHEGMHLRENHVIAQIVDEKGSPVKAGCLGELVITTIGMEAMPLIRYKTGDFTRILPGKCPCGSEAIRLDTVHRRQNDKILALDNIVFPFDSVADYRAQESDHALMLELALTGAMDECALREKILSAFPEKELILRCRTIKEDDKLMCMGKRRIEMT